MGVGVTGCASPQTALVLRRYSRDVPVYPCKRTSARRRRRTEKCRFCCKSLFALAIKISFGCTGDFHVNMWGTSSSEEKLAGDPGNVIEATSIGGRRLDFFTVGKLAPGNFGLLQQYRPNSDVGCQQARIVLAPPIGGDGSVPFYSEQFRPALGTCHRIGGRVRMRRTDG